MALSKLTKALTVIRLIGKLFPKLADRLRAVVIQYQRETGLKHTDVMAIEATSDVVLEGDGTATAAAKVSVEDLRAAEFADKESNTI